MEFHGPKETPYSGLLSSILELTQEIENLEEQPRTGGPRKVLWAKKRFPRQGIRCVGPTQAKRRKYIGATARDFPWCILKKSPQTTNTKPFPIEPSKPSENFRRSGSTETRQETESSSSGPSQNAESIRFEKRITETRNSNKNNCTLIAKTRQMLDEVSKNADNCNPLIDNSIYASSEKNTNAIHSGDIFINQDENNAILATASKTVLLKVSDNHNGTDSSYRKNENNVVVEDKPDNDISCITNDDKNKSGFLRIADGGFDNKNRINDSDVGSMKGGVVEVFHGEIEHAVIGNNIRKYMNHIEIERGRTPTVTTGYCTEDVPQCEIAEKKSTSGRRRSLRKRSKLSTTSNLMACSGGNHCLACADSPSSRKPSSLSKVDSNPSDLSSDFPQKAKSWTKDQWKNFFSVFTVVAAEARTLQSLGSDNITANKRWLQCMRELLQRPPF